MNEARLRQLLREVPVPGEEAAERRGLAVVEAAFAERAVTGETGLADAAHDRRPVSLPRLALVLAAATLLTALLLSPAGAAVRDWVDEVFTATPKPEPGLAQIPGGGRLLVQSAEGPWVVQPDGSRRLLGDYREATWSPHGLFVAVAGGQTLSAVEPDGTPRWSLDTGAAVADPRWAPLGEDVAYRSGPGLRVTAADGTGDRLLAPRVAPVAPAWEPHRSPRIAYVDAQGQLRVADSESGETLGSAPALPEVGTLEWGPSGVLLEASTRALRTRGTVTGKLSPRVRIAPAADLPLPPGALLRDAAIDPGGGKLVAAVLDWRASGRTRSSVLLFAAAGGARTRLLTVPGSLGEVAWSPDGRLLVAWPEADQWLFLPVGERGRPRALSGIAAAFAPGEPSAPFPRVEGWCCHAR
ncbi:MAG: hypothetical protein QOE75_504 [Solirubrobacterales bacterium]|jgi:hypothetical protein|nr:hypothetical protein [Solirubrobacterales bacterium]